MKSFLPILLAALFISACTPQEDLPKFRETIYTLNRANLNPTRGEVTVRELAPGKLEVTIRLQNTAEGAQHPSHLHFGTIAETGELAYALNPVDGSTGESITILDKVQLSDAKTLTYDHLMEMDGSIKVHMNDTYFKHFVLAFANIGKNENYLFDGVAVCNGH